MLVNETETENKTTEDFQEPTLRETLENAFKSSSEESSVKTEANANETVEQRAERARNATGQFTKDAVAPATSIPPENAKTAAELVAQGTQTSPPTTPMPPRGWSPEAKVMFATLPPVLQAEIHKREQDVDAGFSKYKGLDRHVTDFRNAGVEPEQAIAAYRQAEQMLVNNFDEGIVGLCQQFNTHPLALAESLINMFHKPGDQPASGNNQAPPVDRVLLQKVSGLEQRLSKYESSEKQKELNAVETDITTFLTDPSHRFADNVVDEMVEIISQNKISGKKVSLKETYDAACWLNPATRQILIDEQIAAKSKGAIEKASKAASQARAAASSVTGKPVGSTEGARKEKSLREDLEDAFASQRSSV